MFTQIAVFVAVLIALANYAIHDNHSEYLIVAALLLNLELLVMIKDEITKLVNK